MGESMKNYNTDLQSSKVGTDAVCVQDTAIKEYEKPVLISYGDVRDVTLGPTLGGGQDTDRRRVRQEHSEDQRQRGQGLFPPGQKRQRRQFLARRLAHDL